MDAGLSEINPADLREAALRLLARREHSAIELSNKLIRRDWPADQVESLLADLAEAGLQSDQRYAESYARNRAEKYYGPVRIRAELAERGIDRSLIDQTLRELEVDWLERAATWFERRFGTGPADDYKEKTRRQQTLARRGFPHDLVRELVE
jgi:regulatory protein